MNKCERCGLCCKLFLINLNEEEYKSGRYQTINQELGQVDDFDKAKVNGLNFLATNDDGSCIYLVENGCRLHEIRPEACRDFFCTSTDPRYAEMIRQIKEVKNDRN